MTRKDFILIATVVSKISDTEIRTTTAKRFAWELAGVSPTFDSARFFAACGVTV